MGNHHSSAQGKYVLPHGACVISKQDVSAAAVGEGNENENETGQSTRKKSASSDKSSHGSAKSKSKLHQTFSLSFAGRSGKQSRKVGLDCFDSPTKNSRGPVLRQNSAPLSGPSPKKSIKTAIVSGNQVLLASQRMNCSLEKFAQILAKLSAEGELPSSAIRRDVFIKHLIPQSPIASKYMWLFFCNYEDAETINETTFVRSAEKFYTPITDKAQVDFYVKMFGKGKDNIDRTSFIDFLLCAYQMSANASVEFPDFPDSSESFDGKWIEAVAKSCFHLKEEMSLCFTSNWILANLPRILISTHKFVLHHLTTGYASLALATSGENTSPQSVQPPSGLSLFDQYRLLKECRLLSKEATVLDTSDTTASSSHDLNPILRWLLSLSLPSSFITVLDKKPDQALRPEVGPTKQLMQMLKPRSDGENWTLLYHSDDHGLSINRIQFHVFNYKGPTLMFIKAENDYTFCIAADAEWKESCHFWGGEDAMLLQLMPEFRIVEKGTKIIYTNFSIRGYPFGIQIGKDPRNVSVEIKPDFEYVSYKKIPCRIFSIEVWGCAPITEKKAQADHKKWEAKEIEKQRKINLSAVDWSDNPDKYLLELGGAYKSYGNNQ